MLSFAVYDSHGLATNWTLRDAHLVGRDDTPIYGKVAFKDGLIVCRKPGSEPAGLALQFDAGAMGRMVLHTCLLPDRDQPYMLSVELARHRIKTFIAKSEEWQMFDLAANHPAMVYWEEARRLFTRAITTENPQQADRLATQALTRGIDATERLAMVHADVLLHRRYGRRAASSNTLGVRVWPGREDQAVRDLVKSEFDLLVLPLNWRELEVEEGRYDWGPLDRWMDWATRQGKPIIAGPLLDFSRRAMPRVALRLGARLRHHPRHGVRPHRARGRSLQDRRGHVEPRVRHQLQRALQLQVGADARSHPHDGAARAPRPQGRTDDARGGAALRRALRQPARFAAARHVRAARAARGHSPGCGGGAVADGPVRQRAQRAGHHAESPACSIGTSCSTSPC
jgi:hypothetical protein